MTGLDRTVTRRTINGLSGNFGPDRDKRLVVTLRHAGGKDVIALRPERSRGREEVINLEDVYHFAIRARANREHLEKARAKKQQRSEARERRRVADADRRLRLQLRAERPTVSA